MIFKNYNTSLKAISVTLVVGSFLFVSIAYAVTFSTGISVTGNAYVTGSITKGSGSFVIDHPLDPKNKLLYHSFVESPDVKNIYDGVVTLNIQGEAHIALPEYFLALHNDDVRYLATPIDSPMPNLYLSEEVSMYKPRFGFKSYPAFKISGGDALGVISWQVTGIRDDVLIRANPIITEVEKGPDTLIEKGECLFEPLCLE